MAKDVITRFKLETTGFDSKIKQAAKDLSAYSKTATQAKEGFNQFTKSNIDAAKALGTMATSTTNAKDRAKELVDAFNDAAKAYNSLTKEQQQSDWAKALAGSLTQLQQRIKETKQEMQGLGDSMKGGGGGIFSGLGSKMEGALAVFGGNLMTKAAGAVAQLGSEMADMVKQGIEMAKAGEGIRIAFERLGNGKILDGLREATHGTVTDLELMKAAVKFNDFKLPIEELGTMLAFAQQKAKDTGQSVDYMVDSIVTGLGRKSLMILDNLGLSAAEIKEKMAQTGDMTKAVGAIIREQMEKAGDYVETAADRAAQANVNMQNKMEELGRKFGPVEEASNQLWTSMKIGILDIIGGPLATMLNQLTEAGRLKNALNDLNGDSSNGQPTKVQQQLSALRGSNFKNVKYITQLGEYDKQIKTYQTMIDNGGKLPGAPAGSGKDVRWLQSQMDALKVMRSEYIQGAKDIMKPVEANVNTDKAEQNVKMLTAQLKELKKQRKDAVKKGDQEQVEFLTKQISQTKTNLGYLDPNAIKTTKSKQERAEEMVKDALLAYSQTIEKAKMEMESGYRSEADVKKANLSAQERLYDAYGKAYATYADPKYKEAQDAAAAEIVKLGGEVKTATEAQKLAEQAAREQKAAAKKLADAQQTLADAIASGDLKAIYAAQKGVETAQAGVVKAGGSVEAPSGGVALPVTVTYTTSNMEAFTAKLKEDLSKAEVGSELFNKLTEQMSDSSAISTILGTAIQNGIEQMPFDASAVMQQLLNGDNISDTAIQGYVEALNEQLKAAFDETEWPNVLITFDADTKQIVNAAKQQEKEAKKTTESWNQTAQAVQQLGQAMQQIEDPTAKAAGTVLQAISSVALGFAQASVQAASMGPWGWVAFLAAGIAAMTTTINTMHSLTGFANGGIIPGSSMSGDNLIGMTPDGSAYGLNSQEVVLNRAQVGNLASQLEGGVENLQLETRVGAEELIFILNNNGNRRGFGNFIDD